MLEKILSPVDRKWEESVVDAFVSAANGEFKGWGEYCTGPQPENEKANHWRSIKTPTYVLYTPNKKYDGRFPSHHSEHAAAFKAGCHSVDLKLAKKDGVEAYRQTREAFLARMTDKISSIVIDKKIKVEGIITFNRMIEGSMEVTVDTGDSFVMKIAIKTNYRYGRNAANGSLTVYSQYPVTFVRATIKGVKLTDVSEELLANKISGLAIDHKDKTAKAITEARSARRGEKNALVDMKSAVNDIAQHYDSIAYHGDSIQPYKEKNDWDQVRHLNNLIAEYKSKIAKICEKYNIADPGSKKAALALRKSLLTEIRSIGSVR